MAILLHFMCTNEQHLVRVLSDWYFTPLPFYLLIPIHRGATPKLKAFIDFLNDEIVSELAMGAYDLLRMA